MAVHVNRRHPEQFGQLPDMEIVHGLHAGDALDLPLEVRKGNCWGCGFQQQHSVSGHLESIAGSEQVQYSWSTRQQCP